MFFALNTFLWTNRFDGAHLALLAHVKGLGADTIELQCSGFEDFPVEAIRRELERIGLGCTLCTSPVEPKCNLIDTDPDARHAAAHYICQAVSIARDLGGSLVCSPMYSPAWWFSGERRTQEQWRWAVEGLSTIGPDLERSGVTLALEPLITPTPGIQLMRVPPGDLLSG